MAKKKPAVKATLLNQPSKSPSERIKTPTAEERLNAEFANLIDRTIRKHAEGLIKKSDVQFVYDLVEVYIKAIDKTPHNPESQLLLQKSSRDALKDVKRKVDRRSNVSEHPIKTKARIAAVPTRLDLIAVTNSADYFAQFQQQLRLIDKSVLSKVIKEVVIEQKQSETVRNVMKQASDLRQEAVRRLSDVAKNSMQSKELLQVIRTADEILGKSPHLLGNVSANLVNDKLKFGSKIHANLVADTPEVIGMLRDGKDIKEIASKLSARYEASTGNRKYANISARNVITSVYNDMMVRCMDEGMADGTYTDEMFVGGFGAYRFVATLDLRTSELCKSCHDMIIPFTDRAKVAEFTPPLHILCRSRLTPYLTYPTDLIPR